MASWLLSAAILVPMAADAQLGSAVLAGTDKRYTPLVSLTPGETLFKAWLHLGSRVEQATGVRVDRDGTDFEEGVGVDVLARAGLRFHSGRTIAPVNLGVELELDAITGVLTGTPDLDGTAYPRHEGFDHLLRKAFGRVSIGRYLHLLGGYMTSSWGMGLVANDGTHGWTPGSASFIDPRDGDRVLRVMLASGPTTPLGLRVAVGYDWVQGDDILLDGDSANQLAVAVSLGEGKSVTGGVYIAWRTQENDDSGRDLEAIAIDATVKATIPLSKRVTLTLQAEAALITGETTLAPSTDFPTHDILQFGAALRAGVDAGIAGGVLDILYATGDQNLDDEAQNGFKADRNYQLGFLLFRQVLAGHTARATATAGDLNLVGEAALDLDRFPTRGQMTNTIAFFPRAWVRPVDGLEIYAGPLIALSEVPLADPLNTRTNGGVPHNALDGEPGQYLGTEIDLGIRYRALLWGTQLTLGLEGGVFLPGSAFDDANGETMATVYGWRFMLDYRL